MPIAVASSSARHEQRGSGGSALEVRRRHARPPAGSSAREISSAPSAAASDERDAARRDWLWLTSVRVTSPTSKRFCVALSVSFRRSTSLLGEPHELLVAAHVDVGLHRVEQHELLDVLQVGAAGGDRVARQLDRRLGLAVVEEQQARVEEGLQLVELVLLEVLGRRLRRRRRRWRRLAGGGRPAPAARPRRGCAARPGSRRAAGSSGRP